MKIKTAKILSALSFLVFVIALPLVCTFIPYQEPIIVDECFVAPYGESSAIVYGELYNPTIVKVEDLEITIQFYDENDVLRQTKTVVIKMDVASGQTKEFMDIVELNFVFNEQCGYAIADIVYSYTQLSWYLYFLMGLCVYLITYALLGKQKYFFEVNGQKVEVFVSSNKAAIVVDGQNVAETTERRSYYMQLEYKLGESEIKVEARKPVLLPWPKVKITVDDTAPTITDTRQHGFIKIVSKDKKN